jgi:O-antigen/teichoic acid export membrane protein
MRSMSIGRAANQIRQAPRVVQNAVALMVSTGATAVLGVAFWALAARLFSTAAVGRGSAEIAAMMLIAQAAQLNLATALLRVLPKAGTRTRWVVLASYLACIGVSIVGAVVFLATPLSHGVVVGGLAFSVLFAVAVPLWTVFVVQDGVLTAFREARWVPVENTSFGFMKLLLLPVLAVAVSAHGVFLAWTIPVVLAVTAVTSYLFGRVIPVRMATARRLDDGYPSRPPTGRMLSFLTAEYVTGLVSVVPTFLLPLIVIKELGADANAHFYIPWFVGIAFFNLLLNISASFVVEISHAEDPFHSLFWRTLRLMIGITIVAMIVTIVVGPVALRLLSEDYAHSGTTLLRLIGLTFPFGILTTMFTSALWAQRRVWAIFVYHFVLAVILIGLTYALLGKIGVDAPGVANLVAVGVVGTLSIPALIGWYRRSLVEGVSSEPESVQTSSVIA